VRVLITGVNGFIGSSLATYLHASGHEIVGSVRTDALNVPAHLSDKIVLDISDSFSRPEISPVDVVIHCAHDFSAAGEATNLRAAKSICAATGGDSPTRHIFISSYSARKDSGSLYARVKYEVESWFLEQGQVVIRPGLVVGNGGMFGRLARTCLRFPILPLPDGGRDLSPLIWIEDLLTAIEKSLREVGPREYNLFNNELISTRELVQMIAAAGGVRRFVVPVPTRLSIPVLELLAKTRLPVPADAGSLKAMRDNQSIRRESHLRSYIGAETPLQIAVRDAVKLLGGG
jgi:nucleoside-diphosphate-sugar epimerase